MSKNATFKNFDDTAGAYTKKFQIPKKLNFHHF